MFYTIKELERRCYEQAPNREGFYANRLFNRREKGLELKIQARSLLVAVIAVGIVFASPAIAFEPEMPELAYFVKTPAMAKKYTKKQLVKYGWKNNQWGCLVKLWERESNWRPEAKNTQPVYQKINGKWTKLYAGGIPQVLHLNPKVSIPVQVAIGLKYIKERYSSPCKALKFHYRHNYY